jgi:Matrixin
MLKRSRLSIEQLEDRLTPSAWGQPWPDPGHLTLSFAPDGTAAGGSPSNLFSLLNATAPTAAWETTVLRAFQTWAVNSNVNIGLVNDGGEALGSTGAVQGDPRFGDIRIAARPLAPTAISTGSPFSWSGTTWSGDVLLNNQDNFGINGQGQYDLYTIALHEAGHVFGIADTTTNAQSVMYDVYTGPRTGLSSQDIADIQALYGVRTPASNISFATATQLGQVPVEETVQGDVNSGNSDYYKFNLPVIPLLSSFTIQVKCSGLSLLVPSVSVYDAGFHLIGFGSASSPLSNDVTVNINPLASGSTFYLRVSGATNDVFGTGAFQATIAPSVLPILNVVPLVGPMLNNTLSSALVLQRAFGNNTDQRFDYLHKSAMYLPGQQDYYQIQSPAAPAGSTFVMHALVWALDVNGLNPVIHVFDANQNPLPVQILGNTAGLYSIQILGVASGSTFYIEVAAQNPQGSNSTGNYELGVKFSLAAPVVLSELASNVITSATETDSASLTMNQNGLFHFALNASNGSTSSSAVVTMTIYNQAGTAILSLSATTGQPPVTGVVYLTTGTYQIRYSVTSASGVFLPINYWLFGEILSDPIGPYQTSSSTNSPTTGSASSSGATGYNYSGSSSTNTSTASAPTYY